MDKKEILMAQYRANRNNIDSINSEVNLLKDLIIKKRQEIKYLKELNAYLRGIMEVAEEI